MLASSFLSSAVALADDGRPAVQPRYKHVLLISVDGMHAIDLKNWVASHPNGNFASLAAHGVQYPGADTTAPSDSYPGMLAQVTGGTPKTAGLFYDDSYDRTEYHSQAFYTSQGQADPGCTGPAGTELTNFEELDKSYNFSTALVADYTGGGTLGQVYTQLDPDHMQRKLVDGNCVPVYPHRMSATIQSSKSSRPPVAEPPGPTSTRPTRTLPARRARVSTKSSRLRSIHRTPSIPAPSPATTTRRATRASGPTTRSR
jgi:hypothetical protein